MSLAKYFNIQCDGCLRLHGDGHGISDTPTEARSKARKSGWKRTPRDVRSGDPGQDWCPRCAPGGAR